MVMFVVLEGLTDFLCSANIEESMGLRQKEVASKKL